MDFNELIRTRRSVRKYKDIKIDDELLNEIVKAGLLAPTSKNLKSSEVIIVTDKGTIKKLAKARINSQAFTETAAAILVVIADKEKTSAYIEDASNTAMLMLLEAENLGLGACWIQLLGRTGINDLDSNQYVKDILNVPTNYDAVLMIDLGYKDMDPRAYTDSDINMERLHREEF
ncbi:MAG: nitroreductase family protein [Acholeplasmatales bacterium]|nr:nitroreductase family protein [Acholeplasmatales bacterium]